MVAGLKTKDLKNFGKGFAKGFRGTFRQVRQVRNGLAKTATAIDNVSQKLNKATDGQLTRMAEKAGYDPNAIRSLAKDVDDQFRKADVGITAGFRGLNAAARGDFKGVEKQAQVVKRLAINTAKARRLSEKQTEDLRAQSKGSHFDSRARTLDKLAKKKGSETYNPVRPQMKNPNPTAEDYARAVRN